MPEPKNKKLYEKVKNEAKKKYSGAWPSAYASGWLVQEYKRRGGTYKGAKPKDAGLTRWFKEEWVDVCELPKKVRCGREKASAKDYPYCRPSKRVNSKTPKTVKELTKKQLQKRCATKKKSPKKRIV